MPKTPREEVASPMSVPARRGPSTRWDVIRFALRSNRYTFRLVCILLAVNSPLIVAAVKLSLRVPW